MSENVPAWKKIGLKVKETQDSDPLAITAHLDSAKVSKKQVKQINKRKLDTSDADKKQKKPAKRVKLPKSERPPPPEKDQLVYLKTYSTDKENWKFSKQKQNWILKHIKVIEDQYEDYLVSYLEGLQGGGRDRLVERLKKVVESWNTAAIDEPKTEDQKLEDEAKKEAASNDAEQSQDLESVDADYTKRARKIIEAMTEEKISLRGIDDEEAESSKPLNGNKLEEESKNELEEDSTKDGELDYDNVDIEHVEVTNFVEPEDKSYDSELAESVSDQTSEKNESTPVEASKDEGDADAEELKKAKKKAKKERQRKAKMEKDNGEVSKEELVNQDSTKEAVTSNSDEAQKIQPAKIEQSSNETKTSKKKQKQKSKSPKVNEAN
jgi:hypothetical protein